MSKVFLMLVLCLTLTYEQTNSIACKLTVISDPDGEI